MHLWKKKLILYHIYKQFFNAVQIERYWSLKVYFLQFFGLTQIEKTLFKVMKNWVFFCFTTYTFAGEPHGNWKVNGNRKYFKSI